jgi:hypothetical protein
VAGWLRAWSYLLVCWWRWFVGTRACSKIQPNLLCMWGVDAAHLAMTATCIRRIVAGCFLCHVRDTACVSSSVLNNLPYR